MSEPIRPLPWLVRTGAVAFLAVLLATVAVGSHAALRPIGSRSRPVSPATVPAAAVGIPAILAVGGGLVFFVVVLRPARRRRRDPEQPDWVYEPPPTSRFEKVLLLAALLLFMGALAAAAWLFIPRGDSSRPGPPPATAERSAPATTRPSVPTFAVSPRPVAWPWRAVGVAATAASIGLLVVWTVRRRRHPTTDSQPIPDPMANVLDTSLEELRVVSDPRQAILAAYARMEQALSPQGIGRQRHETALEYLDRLLARHELEPAPLQRLTGLFELAKFSDHQVTEAMRDDALAALGTISAALRSPS